MAYSGKWSRAKKEPSIKIVEQTVPEMYQSQEKVSVIHASINSVDKVARDIEQRWGIGKLEKLCDPALATRFEQARQNLNYALRMENITEVVALVDEHRNAEYGDPMLVMDKVANMFDQYLKGKKNKQFVAEDVVMFNIIQKAVRLSFNPNSADSWKDIAGYS